MSKKWLLSGILVAGAALVLAQNSSWLTGTTDEKFDKLANIQPGLGTVMIEYANRFGNIYYAAQVKNWGMAAYQLKEMPEIQEVAENTRPGRKEALQGFEKGALVPLAVDIVNQDLDAFNRDFAVATAFCNGCHIANNFAYIQYKLPAQPAAPTNMDVGLTFSSDELRAILADLLAQANGAAPSRGRRRQ
jgi:hypothetical protein